MKFVGYQSLITLPSYAAQSKVRGRCLMAGLPEPVFLTQPPRCWAETAEEHPDAIDDRMRAIYQDEIMEFLK